MAKSTFLELSTTACSECGIGGTGPSDITGQSIGYGLVIGFVADADREIQGLWFDWDFLHVGTFSSATVSGTAAVSAPADIGVWDEDSFYLNYSAATYKKLSVIDYKIWRVTLRQGVRTNQKPNNVVIMPDLSLKLDPPPDAVYTLTADYWKRPAKMTASGSTSPIPEEYERIIIARAKMSYGAKKAAPEIYQAGMVEYSMLLEKLESKYLPNQKGRMRADAGMMTVIPE
jgi:hypothetical protein